MERRDLDRRLLLFAADILRLVGVLPKALAGRHVARQVLRSATSVGANYEEAQAAESHADFTHKLQVALKEARETNYWLRLIETAHLLPPTRVAALVNESSQLIAILGKSVARAKGTAK